MKVKKRDLYSGLTEDLIEYFEEKYPLKPNNTYPRIPGEYYRYSTEDKASIRAQIENSKYPSWPFFFSRVVDNADGTQTLHIEMEWFNRTDFIHQ